MKQKIEICKKEYKIKTNTNYYYYYYYYLKRKYVILTKLQIISTSVIKFIRKHIWYVALFVPSVKSTGNIPGKT